MMMGTGTKINAQSIERGVETYLTGCPFSSV